MIPAAALERGERAFVDVLRRRNPDASFVLRERSVGPKDPAVAGKVAARTEADFNTIEEPVEHVAPLSDVEAAPKRRKRPSGRNPSQAGG